MDDIPVTGNILQNAKYKKIHQTASAYEAVTENGSHADYITRFNGKQGHGVAAEQVNDLLDRAQGRGARILGDDNAKNGPDRVVDGRWIQTKYYNSAYNSVDAAFDKGQYRYYDAKGKPMQLEVPKDQYEEAIRYMEKRILKGQVKGVTDPKEARRLVRQGNVDYKTALRIAKAGNIDSLLFDAANGAVVATSALGISATISFARAVWNGEDMGKAAELAVCEGLRSGGAAFASSVVTAQLVRTSLNHVLLAPSLTAVKALPPSVRTYLANAFSTSETAISGGAATQKLAKIMRGNIIAMGAMVLVMSAGDIANVCRGRISAKQLFKNVANLVGGISGGYVGGAIGSGFGPAGTVIGGIIGGTLSGLAAHSILDKMIEDDAVAMLRIIDKRLMPLAQEYLLSEEELGLVYDEIGAVLSRGELLNMYASEDRDAFADKLITKCIEDIVEYRVAVSLPAKDALIRAMDHVLTLSQKEGMLNAYFAGQKVDAQRVGKQLLGRDVPKQAANKAFYVTKQMNTVNLAKEATLARMQAADDALQHAPIVQPDESKRDWQGLFEEIEKE